MAPHDDSAVLHGLFEMRVDRHPDRTALEYEGREVSYRELNHRANKIAHHLRDSFQVGPDDRVAVLVQDPVNAVVATLGTLKAGGAYVPIDPGNPPVVTQQILADSAPVVLILDSPSASGAAFFDGDIFVIDVMGAALTTPPANPSPVTGPSNLAYVMYTSGTTGTPKGVAVEHRAIVNTIRWRNSYYQFGTGDASLAVSRLSFDSSVEDLFCMITSGGRLVLVARHRITDRVYLRDLVIRRQVSHLLITPTLYQRLLPELDEQTAPSLRGVALAGESPSIRLVDAHHHRLPGVSLYNEYGPAENAVCSTVHAFSRGDTDVLIGRPISNVDAFVVDHEGNPAAPGETGELYLAGSGLARHYLHRADLTGERFITWRERRVFRTGDLVCTRQDGNLRFVGRADRQVKIRGQRVEPDHVAEFLRHHPAVDDAYVATCPMPDGTPQLIAFVVAPTQDLQPVRESARQSLPDHLVPSGYAHLTEFPVTSNGKIDERALLTDYARSGGNGMPGTAGVTVTEKLLLTIWQELLPHARIDIDDDFFEVGADSVTVMDLIARVETETGIQMDSAEAYAERTIRRFARKMDDRQLTDRRH